MERKTLVCKLCDSTLEDTAPICPMDAGFAAYAHAEAIQSHDGFKRPCRQTNPGRAAIGENPAGDFGMALPRAPATGYDKTAPIKRLFTN